jgi:hypothetical protein
VAGGACYLMQGTPFSKGDRDLLSGFSLTPVFVAVIDERIQTTAFSAEAALTKAEKTVATAGPLWVSAAAGSASPGRTNLTVIMVGAAQTRPRTAPAAHATFPLRW